MATNSLIYAFRETDSFLSGAVQYRIWLIFLACIPAGLLAFRHLSIMCLLELCPSHEAWGTGAPNAGKRSIETVAMNSIPALPGNPVPAGVNSGGGRYCMR